MDDLGDRIELALGSAFTSLRERSGPPRLGAAMRYSVFPGGARLRPKLTMQVARALGDPEPRVTDAAATAVELIHCASLVHDDLPCFDDAAARRGQPTVHVAFDEPTAVLVGDALIVMAFQVLAKSKPSRPERLADLTLTLCKGVGHPGGIIAGQAWESEPGVALFSYHRAKTAALFEAACALGAIAAGGDPAAWAVVGELLGRAYQIADDIADATLTAETLGKNVGVDSAKQRPSAFDRLGEQGCRDLLDRLLHDAAAAVPECPGREPLRRWLRDVSLGVLRLRYPQLARAAESSRQAAAPPEEAAALWAAAAE
ncbi:MAG: polyprenyl synthetase family protein [Polyangiaceae bacterium]